MVSTSRLSGAFQLRANPHLYEINTWAWLEHLSDKLGRLVHLADVPNKEWDALAERGFDVIWLMGVWQRSEIARRLFLEEKSKFASYDSALPGWKPSDVIASPYSVAGYVPDPRIGTWDTLDLVREKLRVRGMGLFLDFVGNHTALDHPWTREHPEFYVQGTQQDFETDPNGFYRVHAFGGDVYLARGRDPYFPPWSDVAQLNHFQPEMRAAQIAELRTIAAHCDGIRCDMAMLHLNDIFGRVWGHLLAGTPPPAREFWSEVHEALPGLILLAEAYWGTEARMLGLGFSFTYNKELYDLVRDSRPADARRALLADVSYQNRMGRFLENHDEPRCAAVFGPRRISSAETFMGTLPGLRFYHQGELEGRSNFLPITLRTAADEPPNPAAVALFDKILGITNGEIFHLGQWRLLSIAPDNNNTADNLIAWEWRLGHEWKVIVVNITGDAGQGRVALGDRVLSGQSYIFHDELDDQRYKRNGDELRGLGLFVFLDSHHAHLFDITLAE